MTTNVRDSASGILATDSRWTWSLSVEGQTVNRFLDDTGYEKIITTGANAFMFAGNARVIDRWKINVRLATSGSPITPWDQLPIDGIAISIVDMPSGRVRFEEGHDIRGNNGQVSFAGSGSYAAAQCWFSNKCALTAVESAKAADQHTGGVVKFQNIRTGESNLLDNKSLDELINLFTGKGAAMLTNSTNVTPITVNSAYAANDDALVQAMKEAYAKGNGPTAPCDAVFKVWTPDEKQKLVSVMEDIFS